MLIATVADLTDLDHPDPLTHADAISLAICIAATCVIRTFFQHATSTFDVQPVRKSR